jgi:hypothetical protein
MGRGFVEQFILPGYFGRDFLWIGFLLLQTLPGQVQGGYFIYRGVQ